MHVKFIGDTSPIAKDLRLQMRKLEIATKTNNGLNLNVALNYGGRDEIVRSAKKFAKLVSSNKMKISDLNVDSFSKLLDTKYQNDPDFIIRTAGEQRISNFLLWQSAYSEFYFTHRTWPEFTVFDLEKALDELINRDRTFGKNIQLKV